MHRLHVPVTFAMLRLVATALRALDQTSVQTACTSPRMGSCLSAKERLSLQAQKRALGDGFPKLARRSPLTHTPCEN
eukprot:1159550-Pelagomonas_calceolata.AAC.8